MAFAGVYVYSLIRSVVGNVVQSMIMSMVEAVRETMLAAGLEPAEADRRLREVVAPRAGISVRELEILGVKGCRTPVDVPDNWSELHEPGEEKLHTKSWPSASTTGRVNPNATPVALRSPAATLSSGCSVWRMIRPWSDELEYEEIGGGPV